MFQLAGVFILLLISYGVSGEEDLVQPDGSSLSIEVDTTRDGGDVEQDGRLVRCPRLAFSKTDTVAEDRWFNATSRSFNQAALPRFLCEGDSCGPSSIPERISCQLTTKLRRISQGNVEEHLTWKCDVIRSSQLRPEYTYISVEPVCQNVVSGNQLHLPQDLRNLRLMRSRLVNQLVVGENEPEHRTLHVVEVDHESDECRFAFYSRRFRSVNASLTEDDDDHQRRMASLSNHDVDVHISGTDGVELHLLEECRIRYTVVHRDRAMIIISMVILALFTLTFVFVYLTGWVSPEFRRKLTRDTVNKRLDEMQKAASERHMKKGQAEKLPAATMLTPDEQMHLEELRAQFYKRKARYPTLVCDPDVSTPTSESREAAAFLRQRSDAVRAFHTLDRRNGAESAMAAASRHIRQTRQNEASRGQSARIDISEPSSYPIDDIVE